MVERSSRSWGTWFTPSNSRKTMNISYTIREFVFPQDYDSVRYLWTHAGDGLHIAKSDEPDEIQKKIRRDPDLFLVAELDGQIVGTVLGGFDGRRGIMYHLAVAEQYQKHGIASALVHELENRLITKGCIRMYMLVYESNQTAIDFYEKRGYSKMNVVTYGKDLQ